MELAEDLSFELYSPELEGSLITIENLSIA
jgi:hypothetical protein